MRKLFFLMALFVSVSCANKEIEIYIDNPSDRNLSIEVGNQTYLIPRDSIIKITLKTGEHEFIYDDNSTFVRLNESSSGSIINPTGANYFLAYTTIPISDNETTNRSLLSQYNDTISIYDMEVVGPFVKISDFFIGKDVYHWDLSLDDVADDEVNNQLQSIVRKVYREPDFWENLDAFYIEEVLSYGEVEFI